MITKRIVSLLLVICMLFAIPSFMEEKKDETKKEETRTEETKKEEAKTEENKKEEAKTEENKTEETKEKVNYFSQINTVDIFGKPFDVKTLEGKPIMINIWASWCTPCVNELKVIDELAKKYKDKISIIGLYEGGVKLENKELVKNEEGIENAKKLYEKLGLSFTSLIADKSVLLELLARADALPTTWFIDKEGQPMGMAKGARTKEQWEQIIEKVIEEANKAKTEEKK